MIRVGIVAALATEARALTSTLRPRGTPLTLGDGTLLIVSGIGCAAASAAAATLIGEGARALVSFGMAGGLDPALQAGQLFLPDSVLAADHGRYETSSLWRARLADTLTALAPVVGGALLTSPRAVTAIDAKQSLFQATHARAVDMESAAIAQVASAHGVPFLVSRVIVDTASDTLPSSVMAASRSGELQIWRLMAALTRTPAEIVDLLRLARRFRAAHQALRAVGRSQSLRQVAGP